MADADHGLTGIFAAIGYPEELLRVVGGAIDASEDGHLYWYTRAVAALNAATDANGEMGLPPGERLYTAAELAAAVIAVELAHQDPSATIMGHIRSAESVSSESADALREIVVAAFNELRIGR